MYISSSDEKTNVDLAHISLPCPRISIIPRVSLTAENVYVVNHGQTAPSPRLIGLLNLINILERFSPLSARRRSRTGPRTEGHYQVHSCKKHCMYNRAGCFILGWSRSMATLEDSQTRSQQERQEMKCNTVRRRGAVSCENEQSLRVYDKYRQYSETFKTHQKDK
jgi:hypothetical protein